jgi:pimeloyl-ACP methyl ester carboxylesterase
MILASREAGAGPPLALLHGLFGASRNFATLSRTLSQTYRVISLDARNHGTSPHATGMSYPELAADVIETLASLGALPAVLLGHSMGGKTAMAAGLLHPDAVQRLIVADIAPVPYHHANTSLIAALLALQPSPNMTRAHADAALAGPIPNPGVRAFLLQNFVPGDTPGWRIGLAELAAGMSDIEGWPDFPSAARYDGKTLFLAGADSDYLRPEHWPGLKNRFPAARLETLANAGHWLHADQPAAFTATVTAFLAELA